MTLMSQNSDLLSSTAQSINKVGNKCKNACKKQCVAQTTEGLKANASGTNAQKMCRVFQKGRSNRQDCSYNTNRD